MAKLRKIALFSIGFSKILFDLFLFLYGYYKGFDDIELGVYLLWVTVSILEGVLLLNSD